MHLTPSCLRGATALVVLVTLAGTAPLAQAAPHSRFFLSPSHNISCELDTGRSGVPDAAFCQSLARPSSVTLGTNGKLKICHGTRCLGNPPERDPTLPYGHSVKLGPFRCDSSVDGITCLTRAGGFEISRDGVFPVLRMPPAN
jgi:hypothetical protein